MLWFEICNNRKKSIAFSHCWKSVFSTFEHFQDFLGNNHENSCYSSMSAICMIIKSRCIHMRADCNSIELVLVLFLFSLLFRENNKFHGKYKKKTTHTIKLQAHFAYIKCIKKTKWKAAKVEHTCIYYTKTTQLKCRVFNVLITPFQSNTLVF